jgi:TatD DNase family protein
MFVDSHAHLDGPEFNDIEDVLKRAREAGIKAILNVCAGDPSTGTLERAAEFCESREHIYGAVGVHPHDAKLYDESIERRIRSLLVKPCMVALGEIGLDYHYDHSPREVQRAVFARQLQLACELKLPVIIHSREADEDTVSILRSEISGRQRPGIMHCFGGGEGLATAALDLGFLISFAGNVTFKKADSLRDIARQVPLDRLLIETDCPFLAPVPLRGRRNEPSFVPHTAAALAALHSTSVEEIGQRTTKNFLSLFGIIC